MRDFIWGTRVVGYPEGAMTEEGFPVEGWVPENWSEARASLLKAGLIRPEEGFFWPKDDKIFLSRSSALKRAKLLASYGAEVELVRSRIDWHAVGVAS